MTWISSNWIITGTGLGVDPSSSTSSIYDLTYRSTSKTFLSTKTYQVVTDVRSFYTSVPGLSFSLTFPSGSEKIQYDIASGLLPSNPGNGNLYTYVNLPIPITTTDYAVYQANGRFGTNTTPTEKIQNIQINEIDWRLQGFSWFKSGSSTTLNAKDALGWVYDASLNAYIWFDHYLGTSSTYKNPAGGPYGSKSSNSGYRTNNYISKFIGYSFFNISFYYQKLSGGPNDYMSIYLSPYLQSNTPGVPMSGTLIATMSGASGSATFSAFYGLQGNQYIYFVGSKASIGVLELALSSIKIEGGYHSGNNQQYLMTNSLTYSNPTTLYPIGLTGATYSAYSGYGNTVNATGSLTVYQINANIGNGNFHKGIWENGVWNSGWRFDETVFDFYNIGNSFDFNRTKQWRFIITGPASSVSQFRVGDKVSIGNIVAIDINEDRKLIKNYFTITAISTNSIIVELTNSFPLRRIERDSPNHRIYVTKNVWLSGAFLNGYYTGVWNSGLFKGYPRISEMYDTHWIDGTFDGGHYHADQLGVSFVDTVYTSPSGLSGDAPKLGLTFSIKHHLNVGDVITIDKNNKTINPQYDGTASVISVPNDYQIVCSKDWGSSSLSEAGNIYTHISSGVIQNFIFKSDNISKITSVQSLDSDTVFVYNSWIDVNYDNYSAVNIGKPHFLLNKKSRRAYSENNLYGYPTNDVLSSNSTFRDSFSTNERSYKLGTKYKIFNDYIGDSSKFDEFFGPTGSDADLFISQGWTYSVSGYLTFSRTVDLGVDPIIGEELKVEALGSGGILDFNLVEGIINRTNAKVEKSRYTMVEFDMITYSVDSEYSVPQTQNTLTGPKNKGDNVVEPQIHFNNINVTNRDINYFAFGTYSSIYSTVLDATYLPIYKNVDHISTPYLKKQEYFFNKRDLSMHFRGAGLYGSKQSTFILDNLKYYEVDMIPFFQYYSDGNINFGVQVPYQGIAPFIDYTNSNFSFIDNISIGLSSIKTQQSFVPFSGVGVGIGAGSGTGAFSSGSGNLFT